MRPHTKQSIIVAVVLHIIALIYLYALDLHLVQTGELTWNSELGHILLVPVAISMVYAWTMVLCIPLVNTIHDSRVSVSDSDMGDGVVVLSHSHNEWTSHQIHWSDKHAQVSAYFN